MHPAELVLSILGSSPSPIDGRTAIQKIGYFSSIKTGTNAAYKPHFYGPYSPVIAGLLENFASMGYIAEEARVTTHERIMYSYFLTKDGTKLLNEIQKHEPNEYAKVARVVDMCGRVTGNNINVLSWAAKVYYLLSQKGPEISYEEAVKAGRRFGWKLPQTEIDSGVRLLTTLGLATRSKS